MFKRQLTLFSVLFLFCTHALAVQIYAHRGGRGLSPENTLPAYQTSLGIGVDYVDMDINMTKDGTLVVQHDRSLNPAITKGSNGQFINPKQKIWVKDLTFQQLEQYTVGEIDPKSYYHALFPYQHSVPNTHIPTLVQVIHYIKSTAGKNVGFQIEIKTNPLQPNTTFTPEQIVAALDKILQQEKIVDRTEVQAFDWRCLIELQKIDPTVTTVYLTDKMQEDQMRAPNAATAGVWTAGYLLKNYDNSIPKMIAALGGKVWGPQFTQVTKARVAQAHKLGLKVVPWPWRLKPGVKTAEMAQMIDDGVDGVITDRPDILRGLIAARGMNLPIPYALRKTPSTQKESTRHEDPVSRKVQHTRSR